MAPVVESATKLVFDMSAVQFVDSSGLGAILSCLRQLNARGGDLKVFGLSKGVRALFELVRMHKVVEIHNTREEAIAAFAV
jgi:anti-sigma B factor antagonist